MTSKQSEKQLVEIEVTHHPAVVDFDFDGVKSKLTKVVDEYNIVVTRDTVKDAKNVAAKLNKIKKEISDRLVKVAKEMEVKPKQLRAMSKELGEICDNGRSKITEQVDRFEDEQRKVAKDLLETHLCVCIAEYKVTPKFQTATIDDLVNLTALNSKGDSLTKAARDEVENRVAKDASAQQKVELRHTQLENKSYKAGLSSPLTPDHVAAFINDSDDEYESKLNAMLEREVQREAEAKARYEREAKEKHDREMAEQQRQHEAQLAEQKRQAELKQRQPEQKTDQTNENGEQQEPLINEETKSLLDKTFSNLDLNEDEKVVAVRVMFAVKVKQHVNPDNVAGVVEKRLREKGFDPSEVTCA